MIKLTMNRKPGRSQFGKVCARVILAGFLWAGLIYFLTQLPVNAGVNPTGGTSKTTVAKSSAPIIVKQVFDNGLTMIVKPNPANEVVSVQALIRMGGIYEPQSKRGLSKLMQQVLLKGTTTRGAKEIVLETESVGASIDAGLADSGYGSVSLKTTLAGFEQSLPVFLDILKNPAFGPREFAKEKQLMLQQLTATNDDPADTAYLNFRSLFYGDYPLGMKSEEIAKMVGLLTRDDLVDWYQKTYVPNNMVISIVGNVDPERMSKIFQDALGAWTKGKGPTITSAVVSPLDHDRQIIKTRDSQAIFMILGYPAPDIFSGDYPAMEVLNYVLGGDMGSRLFVELRDKKGLAYNVSTGYYPSNYPSNIFAFMATAPRNYNSAREGIINEFRRITTEPVSPEELKNAKQALKGSFLMSHETNASQGRYLGSFELLGLGYQYGQTYPGLIDKVTAEDIQRVARKYFRHYVLSVLTPVTVKEEGN
jgi:predicted Zn-dependent peptidase